MEQINYQHIVAMDHKYGTPFYVMDPEKYRSNIRDFLAAFRSGYEKIIAGYSFKTNYVPELCSIAKEEGCYAEVVSEMEFALAEKIGFKHIIFNGPIKRHEILIKAIESGAIVNLDSEYELETVCQYKKTHPDADVRVGVRVNVNLTDVEGRSSIQCGLRFGRFGFPSDILGTALARLKECGIKIISLHGHTSSNDRAVNNYKIITRYMLTVCGEYDLIDLTYFNIGGGFFGAAPDGMDLTGKPVYRDYSECVLSELENNVWFQKQRPYIVIEPGSSVVSNVFTYYTKVYQNKKVESINFVMVDGTVFDVKPTMHQGNLPCDVYRASGNEETYVCDVVGSTCMEKDIILKDVLLPKLENGDYIRFKGVGAYTLCLTPTFINFQAPVLMIKDGKFRLVRRRQEIDDILQVYNV